MSRKINKDGKNSIHLKIRINRNALKWGARIISGLFVTILLAAGISVIVVAALRFSGKSRLLQGNEEHILTLAENLTEDTDVVASMQSDTTDVVQWEEGDIRYKGEIYSYKNEVMTFLFLGIDKKGVVKEAKNFIDGGQSDVIFLAVLDPDKKSIQLIAVPRDTMADIAIYDKKGNYLNTQKAQIALQHGYGDGLALSAQRAKDAVSNLFYGIPIHGYCTLHMGGIAELNDAVGGISLQSLDTFTRGEYSFQEGETVTLQGMGAYHYLQYRDTTVAGSAGIRLQRQKQYIAAYINQAKGEIKKNLTFALTLYHTLAKYMVTDITADEVTYLAGEILDYQFANGQIYSLTGETIFNETDQHEELHLDEEALKDLVIHVFYEKKSNS